MELTTLFIQGSTITKTVKQLYRDRETMDFGHTVQRGMVWKDFNKSLFQHSLIFGYPYPPIYALGDDEGNLSILDGKQRLTSTFEFVDDIYALHPKTPSVKGEKIAGKKFSELPEKFQDAIYSSTFLIYKYSHKLPQSEITELFLRLNGGVPLTKYEKSRVVVSTEVLELVDGVKQMDFFAKAMNMSKPARSRYMDEELIFQILLLLNNDKDPMELSNKNVRRAIVAFNNELPQHIANELITTSEYLSEAVPAANKHLKKSHIPTLFLIAIKAMEQNVPSYKFGAWVEDFFKYGINNQMYMYASTAGSSNARQINTKLNIMDRDFKTFLNKEK